MLTTAAIVPGRQRGCSEGGGDGLTAAPGAIHNGEFISVSVQSGEPASNAGQTHHRYTLGGDWYHVDVVDGTGASVLSYVLNRPVSVCIPLSAGLGSNIADVSVVAMKSEGFAVVTSRVQIRPGGNTQICGNLSELPAQIAPAKRGAPTPLPTAEPESSEPETPDTGGSVPGADLPPLFALIGLLAILIGTYFALKGKRTPSHGNYRATK